MRLFLLTGVLLLSSSSALHAQLEVPRDSFEFDADLNGRGEKMNYGPFLSYTLFNAQRDPSPKKKVPGKLHLGLLRGETPPVHLRCINIHLGGKYKAAFDTETCSYAAAWAGGPLDISRTNLNGYKGNDLGYLRLPALFQNTQTPGWSLDGNFSDPRTKHIGALPKSQAHYKGLYLHGYKTILSYTVGTSRVLEMPGILEKEGHAVFYRDLNISASKVQRFCFVCELEDARAEWSKMDGVTTGSLSRADATLRIAISGDTKNVSLQFHEGKAFVRLPPLQKAIKLRIFQGNNIPEAVFAQVVRQVSTPLDLAMYCKGGPPRWQQVLTTRGQPGNDKSAYAIDNIAMPNDNPWHSWMRPSAIDFLPGGDALLCTWNGDVWRISGLDDDLQHIRWRRFATGLFEPLGIKVRGNQIFVLGRDQITRLHDLNGDGEADWYENFNNDAPTAPSFHSFAIELDTDSQGNFYYVRGAHRVEPGTPMHGGVIKVSRDGSHAEIICSGLREPNGMGIGPNDLITVADNQGNWVPSSKIDIVEKGGFYGYVWDLKPPLPKPARPLCWIPMSEDNSSGSQIWVNSKKWGPFQGRMLHTSYGTCKLFLVLMQRDGKRFQGGIVSFPWVFPTGIMRGKFSPHDGQLYLCGLKGWGTKAKADGGLYRVRYTGKPVHMPTALEASKNKIAITFTNAIKRPALETIDIEQWNYRWTEAYGSKDYSVAHPERKGRDKVSVEGASLSQDGKTLTLTIPNLQPVMQMRIHLPNLQTTDGTPTPTTIHNTINYLK